MTQREGPEAGLSMTGMFGRVPDPRSALDTLARQFRAFSWSPQDCFCPSIPQIAQDITRLKEHSMPINRTPKFHISPRAADVLQGFANGLKSVKKFSEEETAAGRPISPGRVGNILGHEHNRNDMTTFQLGLAAYALNLISLPWDQESLLDNLGTNVNHGQNPVSGNCGTSNDGVQAVTEGFVALNTHDKDRSLKLIDKEYHCTEIVLPQSPSDTLRTATYDRFAFAQALEKEFFSFPDIQYSYDIQVFGNSVFTLWRATGTHAYDYWGFRATGEQAEVLGISIEAVRDGKIVDTLDIWPWPLTPTP